MDALGTCDADGSSRAAVRIRLVSGRHLEFCHHHWHANELAMTAAGAVIELDDQEALYTKT